MQRTVYWHCEFDKKSSTINLSDWQFVIHGQGAKLENVSGLYSCILHSCNFYQMLNLQDFFFRNMQAWSETYKNFKFILGGNSPARICFFFKFPKMQCAGFVLHERLSKVALRKWVVSRSLCQVLSKKKKKKKPKDKKKRDKFI